ncbi:hypothetical protein ACF0H5_009582 [Mactra antiquata]
MAQRKYDYHVIYNEAFTKRSETDDTKLSEQFTKYLVDKFKPGKVGYFSKTDKVPGENVFKVLAVLVKNTDKTIVVVTPGFLQNCWKTFCHQSAFKSLIDTDKCEKLIPIALCLTEEEMKSLEELNIKEWVDFDANYMIQNEDNENNWKLIGRALDCTDSLETLRRYDRRPHINAQECADNRLRSDAAALVTQPTSSIRVNSVTEFFSDKLILKLAENLPSDWSNVCINLGLKYVQVTRIKKDYPLNCIEQALNGIKCALNAMDNDEEQKYNSLKDVLTEVGRVDRAQWLEGKYRKYMERNGPPNVGENVTGNSLPLDTYDGASQVNQISAGPGLRQSNGTTDMSEESTRMAREIIVETCTETFESREISSDTVTMDAGPSVSLPSVQIPIASSTGKVTVEQSPKRDGADITQLQQQNKGHNVQQQYENSSEVPTENQLDNDGSQFFDEDTQFKLIHNEEDTQVKQLDVGENTEVKEPLTQPGSTEDSRDRQHASKDDVLNNCDEDMASDDKIEETKVKQVYGNQPSISKDIDLSIDALRSSDDQEEHTSAIASALDNAEMLDLKSLQQDSVTPDSGLSSMANTPSSRGHPIEEQLNYAIGRSALSSCQFDGTPHNEENVTPTVTSQTASMQSVVPPEDAVAQNVNNQTNSVSLDQQTRRDEVQSSFQFVISLVVSLIARPEYAYN